MNKSETAFTLRRVVPRVILYAFNFLWLAFLLAPYVWIFLTSALPNDDLTSKPLIVNLRHLTLREYYSTTEYDLYGHELRKRPALLTDPKFQRTAINSIVCASGTTLLTLAISGPAAYALARLNVKGKELYMVLLMGTLMVPAVVLILPLFMLLRALKLLDTQLALILTYTAFLSPLAVWILRSFFQDIPVSLEKAARIDGCSRLGALVRIILPLSTNGLAAAGMLCFIGAWSDFAFALYLTSMKAKTLPVKVAEFQGVYEVNYAQGAAGAVLLSLPIVLLALLMQRLIVRGLTQGAVKG